MKTPICTFDAKTSVLCTKCETKLRLGQLTHADVDGAIKIAKLAEGSQDVNNFTMLGAYKVDDDFILTLGSSDINILRTHPSVLRKFEDEFQSKVWFVEGQATLFFHVLSISLCDVYFRPHSNKLYGHTRGGSRWFNRWSE